MASPDSAPATLQRQDTTASASMEAPSITPSMFDNQAQLKDNVPFFQMTVEEVQKMLLVPNLAYGVLGTNVAKRRETFGDNVIPTGSGPSIFKMILHNFVNSITLILAFVAIVSGVFQDWAAFGLCIFVIVFVGVVGVYQEWNAATSLESLKTMTKGTATVIRDGKANLISIDDIVIGDVVVLEQGTVVPVDMRLFEAVNLEIDEALLTGEVVPVEKKTHKLTAAELHQEAPPRSSNEPVGDEQPASGAAPQDASPSDIPLGDRINMAYRNTTVVSGRGRGIAVAGGLKTEMGKVAASLSSGVDDSKTNLQRKMEKLMYAIFGVCIILVLIVFSANRWDLTESVVIYAAAVAIAILPQSLVAVVAVSMAISVRKMAAQKCIVRRLGSLEVLDSVTDICSDKTGTLTQNKMVVKSVAIGTDTAPLYVEGAPLEVGAVFVPENVPLDDDADNAVGIKSLRKTDRRYADFFKCAALCGTTVLKRDGMKLDGSGNPTEIAIQAMCWKAGCPRSVFETSLKSLGCFPFDSSIKRMSGVFHDPDSGEHFLCTKGAAERVLELCKWKYSERCKDVLEGDVPESQLDALTQEDKDRINDTVNRFASRGLRTICLARRNNLAPIDDSGVVQFAEGETADKYKREDVESNLIYLGVVGIYDPPRAESKLSVRICQRAGIKVRMLTGDHFATATAIAKEIDILDEELAAKDNSVMVGPDFDKLSLEEMALMEDLPSVIGRCSPDTKVRMIEALHQRNRVCAMTGDGFNDSPAIKKADIGCAMGSGTDVTKGVADFIVTDDNFATIVKAIAEGRRIALAISKYVTHLLSGNVAETVVMIFGLGIMIDQKSVFVLSPMQILWLNLFTSSPPAIGLSVDKAPDDILRIPPNKKGLFCLELLADSLCYGVVMGGLALSSFIYVLYSLNNGPEGQDCNTPDYVGCEGILRARTTCYMVLYFGMLIHAYNVRFSRVHLYRMRWFDNAWLWGSFVFGIATLIAQVYVPALAKNVFVHAEIDWEWFVVLVSLVIFVLFSEVYKLIKNTVDPMPVYNVSKEEEDDEYRLFHGTFQRDNNAENADNRSLEQMAEEEVADMNRTNASFATVL